MSKVEQKRRILNRSDKEEIGLQCCNCGSTEDLQYHHIVPISLGGIDINSNMCCLYYKCYKYSYKTIAANNSNIQD